MGVDHSALAIGYALGMAFCWGLQDRLYFAHGSAEQWVEKVRETYPGRVQLCTILFPTPFLLPTSLWSRQEPIATITSGGSGDEMLLSITTATTGTTSTSSGTLTRRENLQLPTSAKNGFMVTPYLLRLIHHALCGNSSAKREPGRLLVQSNGEDVALWIKHVACDQCGFGTLAHPLTDGLHASSNTPTRIPKRTLEWIAMGGERAVGEEWSTEPLLPQQQGFTETEVACLMNGTPVHRCVLIQMSP